MTSRNKTIAAGAAVAMLASLGWVGASIQTGRQVEAELKALSAHPDGRSAMRLTRLQHDAGLLSSSGKAELQFRDECGGSAAGDSPVTVEVEYRLSHFVLPGSAARFDWTLRPIGPAAAALAQLAGAGTTLRGEGEVGFSGEVRSSMALPELTFRSGEGSLRFAPASGKLAWGRTTLALDVKMDHVVMRGGGSAAELQNVSLAMDLRNRRLGTGTSALSVDKVSTGLGTFEGVREIGRAHV